MGWCCPTGGGVLLSRGGGGAVQGVVSLGGAVRGDGCCLEREGVVLSRGGGGEGGAVQGVLFTTGSDIITLLSTVDRQTGVKTLPCPKPRLRAVTITNV